ncbi:hypothetical protein AAHC03_026896 [Spirometra sp. Aus1]
MRHGRLVYPELVCLAKRSQFHGRDPLTCMRPCPFAVQILDRIQAEFASFTWPYMPAVACHLFFKANIKIKSP